MSPAAREENDLSRSQLAIPGCAGSTCCENKNLRGSFLGRALHSLFTKGLCEISVVFGASGPPQRSAESGCSLCL